MSRTQTVVVIGPGPARDLRGADVDQHTVVRMWNHDWQPVERYGERYDHGFITSLDNTRTAVRPPARSWLFYNVAAERSEREANGTAVVVWEHRGWFRRAMAQGARSADGRALKFTRGFASVAATIEHLRPKRIAVIGMNILRDGMTGPRYFDAAALPYYVKSYPSLAAAIPAWAADQIPAGLRGEGPHDYAAEAVLIRELAAEAGVELTWHAEG